MAEQKLDDESLPWGEYTGGTPNDGPPVDYGESPIPQDRIEHLEQALARAVRILRAYLGAADTMYVSLPPIGFCAPEFGTGSVTEIALRLDAAIAEMESLLTLR